MTESTPDRSETSREVLSVPEAGKRLGLGRAASYRAAGRGQIPTLRLGKKLVVPTVQFERLLAGELSQRRDGGPRDADS